MLTSRAWIGLWIGLSLSLGPAGGAIAYTPHSPEVKAAVEKAIKYLEQPVEGEASLVGGKALLAMAIYKASAKYGAPNPSHPKVVAGVQAIRDGLTGKANWDESGNYSTGIAVMFLCDLDADLYRPEIEALLQRMLSHQRSDGGWGYHGRNTGDTSQTQYSVLAMWAAYYHGIPIPDQAAAAVCNWLIRTQTPGGLWAYQGQDPGHYNRINQPDRITPSMVVAGVGSVYMSADLLGFVQRQKEEDDSKAKALVKVEDKDSDQRKPSEMVNRGHLDRSLADGDRGFAASYNIRTDHWQMYYLYGLERYMSFRELARGGVQKEPGWYNDGVSLLLSSQQAAGNWRDAKGQDAINTAFAVLFLLRSTQDAIQKTIKGEGLLVGGYSLPKDVSNLSQGKDGKVIVPQAVVDLDNLMRELESAEGANLDGLLDSKLELNVDLDSPTRKAQLAKLRSMVAGENYQARRVAVRTLARSGQLDVVPALIFALSDPDARVVREARDGLRFLSRRFDGFGLMDEPSEEQKRQAQEAWTQWYLSIRPDADLEVLKTN
ncbi:MAG: hypothetical protein J5I93_10180 [Pirellulaceae bacterium]|nr:hypothetical protein [Pirellulaceae bacterium]